METSETSMPIIPDSIFDRSRMSLISESKSEPDECMVSANCTCLELRFSSLFSANWRERISMLLSGVRSSCDMLARNSDLYLEVSASCSAFSSISQRASSTSRFFASTSAFCRASKAAFSCSSDLKLGLVFRSERQLLGLFFHLPTSFFDLAVFRFDFRFLPGQQGRLFLQFLVGLA